MNFVGDAFLPDFIAETQWTIFLPESWLQNPEVYFPPITSLSPYDVTMVTTSKNLWTKVIYQSALPNSTLVCQTEGQACLFIFHFLPTWPKLIWPYPFIFSGVVWQPVLSFKSDGPTKTINPVNLDYYTCHLWALCHLFSVYTTVIIHILHDKKTIFIEKLLFLARRLNQKLISNPYLIFGLAEHLVTLTLYMARPLYHLDEMCHPDLIFWPALLFGTWK